MNNRAENSHQPTRERERRMRGFRLPERTQAFLSCFGPIRQHFALKRHLLRASLRDSKHGVFSPALPKLRPLRSEPHRLLPMSRQVISNVTTPSGTFGNR